jgi:hypothetical protein
MHVRTVLAVLLVAEISTAHVEAYTGDADPSDVSTIPCGAYSGDAPTGQHRVGRAVVCREIASVSRKG